jgi:hypothetical protein
MPWVQSHADLRQHPKLKRAARAAGCSPIQMTGHLHWLWWWALDIAPDGDLSPYDPDDIADAAGWEGDPSVFVSALMGCGPGDKDGFLDPDMRLHDWDEYGGKYRKRSEAGRKAAAVRWHSDDDAVSEPANANALQSHCDANAEERRGEDKRKNMADGETFSKRLAKDIRDKGIVLSAGKDLHGTFRNLLTNAYDCYPEDQHHSITLGVIADFVRSADGPEITKEARNHTARLLKTHDRLKVFDAYGQAMQWGAGIGQRYAGDPLALSKYVASIVGGKR